MKKIIGIISLLLLFAFANTLSAQVGSSASNPFVVTSSKVFTTGGQTADTLAYNGIKSIYVYVKDYATLAKAQLNIARTSGSTAAGYAAKLVVMSSMDNSRWVRLDSTATITTTSLTSNYGVSASVTPNAPYLRFWIIGTENVSSRFRWTLNILAGKNQ